MFLYLTPTLKTEYVLSCLPILQFKIQHQDECSVKFHLEFKQTTRIKGYNVIIVLLSKHSFASPAPRNCTGMPEGTAATLVSRIPLMWKRLLPASTCSVTIRAFIANAWTRAPLLGWHSRNNQCQTFKETPVINSTSLCSEDQRPPSLHSRSHSISTSLFSCHAVSLSQKNQTLKPWNKQGFQQVTLPAAPGTFDVLFQWLYWWEEYLMTPSPSGCLCVMVSISNFISQQNKVWEKKKNEHEFQHRTVIRTRCNELDKESKIK